MQPTYFITNQHPALSIDPSLKLNKPIESMTPEEWFEYTCRVNEAVARTNEWMISHITPLTEELHVAENEMELLSARIQDSAKSYRENTGTWFHVKDDLSIFVSWGREWALVIKEKMLFAVIRLGILKEKCVERFEYNALLCKRNVVAAVAFVAIPILYLASR